MNRVMSGLFKLPNSSLVLVAFGRAVKNKFSISRFGTDEKKMYCVFSQRRLYSTGPKDDENVTKLPVETGPKDDDLKNNGVPNAQTAIEFKRARQQKEYRKFENLSRDDLLVYIGKLESDLVMEKKIYEKELETMKGMVGAVGGRGVVDKFFALHVKSYLPEKAPGTSYTTSQIRKAYEDFFNDENNQIAVDFVSYFPNKTSREVAEIYVKLFGKLSWYDHTLFEALLRSQKYEAFIDCIQSIPAVITIDEKNNLEILAHIFLKFNEEWKDYNYKM